jgi:hypothetical protein
VKRDYDANAKHDEIVMWLDANVQDVLVAVYEGIGEYYVKKKIWEYPLEQRGKIRGYLDLWVHNNADLVFMFEVKSYMPSIGALLRQLQYYSYLSRSPLGWLAD